DRRPSAAHALRRVGNGLEPRFGNRHAAVRTLTERAIGDSIECRVDLIENAAFVMQYLDIGIDGFARDVGEMNWSRRDVLLDVHVLVNRFDDIVDFAADTFVQLHQHLAIVIQFFGSHNEFLKRGLISVPPRPAKAALKRGLCERYAKLVPARGRWPQVVTTPYPLLPGSGGWVVGEAILIASACPSGWIAGWERFF